MTRVFSEKNRKVIALAAKRWRENKKKSDPNFLKNESL